MSTATGFTPCNINLLSMHNGQEARRGILINNKFLKLVVCILLRNSYMFRSYDHLQAPEDGNKTETCSGY
jgi:hypothetical protein